VAQNRATELVIESIVFELIKQQKDNRGVVAFSGWIGEIAGHTYYVRRDRIHTTRYRLSHWPNSVGDWSATFRLDTLLLREDTVAIEEIEVDGFQDRFDTDMVYMKMALA
jgi:hypothetical protein